MANTIDELRSSSARFYKADLHVHSPLSHDWKNDARGDYAPNPLFDSIATPKDITEGQIMAFHEELVTSGLDVVAITDHMKWSFGVALAEYAYQNNSSVLVLPGIEINVKFNAPILRGYRIHILAIFPPDIGRTKIDKIFPEPFPDEFTRDGRTAEVQYESIEQLIDKVHELKGHAIAAHIYNNNGFRFAYTNQARLILKPDENAEGKEIDEQYRNIGDQIKDELYKFDCLQVTETTNPVHFNNADGTQAIPLLCCSDSHHITQIGTSSNITYIKMGERKYQCLEEAFNYPDTRLRFKNNLPENKPPRIHGVRIIGREEDEKSFFNNLTIGFSDNLTCLIGPRGSGKSAIIDAIRYAMGYNRTLGEIGSVRDQVLERQEHTLHASKIEILYEKTDTQKHKIVATFDAREPYTTQVQDLDGNTLNIPDIEASNEYPLNLYGWNELELLGEDPRSQRDNLDRFIKVLTLLKNGRSRYYLELENNANACDQQLLELDKFFDTTQDISEFIRLKDYEAGFDKLNTDEMEETFKQFDNVNHKLLFVSKLKDKITDLLNNLENILSLDIEDFLVQQQHELEWCKGLVEDRLDFKEYNDLIAKYKTELEGKLNGYLTIINETEKGLSLELGKITKSINESVGDEKSISGDLRNNAKKRVDDARKYYDLYKKKLTVFESLLEERKKIIENICKSNEGIFATRNREIGSIAAKIQIVEDDSFKVNLKLEQESDRLYLLNSLRDNTVELKYEGQYKRRKIPELLADKLTPFELSKALFNKDKSALLNSMTIKEGEVTQDFEIDDEYAEKLITSITFQ